MLLQCFSDSHCLITSESCLCSAFGAVLIGMADWHVCAFSNAMYILRWRLRFQDHMYIILYMYNYVYSTIFLVHPSPLYSQKDRTVLIVLIHCHGFWWILHVETPMNLMLFVSYIFFVMCRWTTPCGENLLIGDGDAELGLVVLKARNWQLFFENWIARFQFVGWRCVFFPGAEKGFLGKKGFTFPRFKWWCLWSLLKGGRAPKWHVLLQLLKFQTLKSPSRCSQNPICILFVEDSWKVSKFKGNIIWYGITVPYCITYLTYIPTIYTWLIHSNPAINFLWTFWAPNFFRNLPGTWSSRFSSLAFGWDWQFFPACILADGFSHGTFFVGIGEGGKQKMGHQLVEMVQMRFCFAVYTFTIHSNFLQFGYQKNGSLEDQKCSPNVRWLH